MNYDSGSNLKPRDAQTLQVGLIARISGCEGQSESSLDTQNDHNKLFVTVIYEGSVEYYPITTKGKGEWLTRDELKKIEATLRTSKLDLLVMEDLGRLVRGTEAVRLLGIALDHGTCVIAPGDNVDTNKET